MVSINFAGPNWEGMSELDDVDEAHVPLEEFLH